VTYNFSPRLNGSLSETFRFGIEPELVEIVAGVPLVTRRRGDYTYNNLDGNLGYNLTPRWVVNLGASWDRWRYAEVSEAAVNDHDDYGMTISAINALDPRSSVGANYQLSIADYSSATASDTRGSLTHTLYLSYIRRFNPRLSLQIGPGFQVQQLSEGGDNIAPWVNMVVSYVAGARSLATFGFSYYLSSTDISSYRSAANAVMYLNTRYQLTPKAQLGMDFSYVITTYQSPGLTFTGGLVEQQEDSWRINFNGGYNFKPWVGINASYEFSQVISDFTSRNFERNRLSLGVTLRY
jgi:hypothetical protein